jgi:hypothetical protein
MGTRMRVAITITMLASIAALCGDHAPAARAQAGGQAEGGERPERPANAGLHCLEMAKRVLYLADQTAYHLCLGAGSDAPMQCFAAARRSTVLTDSQIVDLCRCATSTGPVQCYMQARAQAFLIDQQLTALCSAVVTQQIYGLACTPRATY